MRAERGTMENYLGIPFDKNGGRKRIASLAPALNWLITKILKKIRPGKVNTIETLG